MSRGGVINGSGVAVFALSLLAQCNEAPTTEPPPPVEEDCPYKLPWSSTLGEIPVTQGTSDATNKSHTPGSLHEFAVDFGLPEGKNVLASREGIISTIHDGETLFGDKGFAQYANYVIIDHEDGSFALYLHLQRTEFTRADEGKTRVMQGQPIGLSGKTGWTDGRPHLHFQLQSVGDKIGQSIPLCFEEVEGSPQLDQPLRSQNQMSLVLGMQVTAAPTPPTSLDPWQVMQQDCMVAGLSMPDEWFLWFRDLWREVVLTPIPEPQSYWDLTYRVSYTPPLQHSFGSENPRSCSYLTIPDPESTGLYLVYRTASGAARKVLVGAQVSTPASPQVSGTSACPVEDQAFCDFVRELEPMIVAHDIDGILGRTRLFDCATYGSGIGWDSTIGCASDTYCANSGALQGEGGCTPLSYIRQNWQAFAAEPTSVAGIVFPSIPGLGLTYPLDGPAILVKTMDPDFDWILFAQLEEGTWQVSAIVLQNKAAAVYQTPLSGVIPWP